MRPLDSSFVSIIESTGGPAQTVALFVRLDFQSLSEQTLTDDHVFLWNGYGNFTPSGFSDADFEGETFLGNGWFHGISEIEESLSVDVNEASVYLDGLKDTLVSKFTAGQYKNRRAIVWFGFLNDEGQLASPPARIFVGRMDHFELPDDPTSSVLELILTGHLVDPQRPKTLRYTNKEQQRLYPGDRGLEYVPYVQDKEDFWGQPDPLEE